MRRVVILAVMGLAACGGPQIPQHSGYKSDKSAPWTKAKSLKLNDKLEAKAEGDLNYGAYKRAKWFSLDLAQHGDLDVKVDITPPGDAANEDFDLGLEIYDPSLRVIAKSDLEDEQPGELNKKKTLKDLAPGKYLIHLYLQGRMDSADFALGATFHPTAAAEAKTDFPAQVMFPPALAMVPIGDDAPANYKPTTKPDTKVTVIRHTSKGTPPPPPDKKPPPPPAASARILTLSVVPNGTQIMISAGTDAGAAVGMHVAGKGISGAITACNARSCTAVVAATPDQIKAAGMTVSVVP